MQRSNSPTQLDIAQATGLSQATVSRALRGDNAVIRHTRELVMRTCVEMGYRPSISARVLAEGREAIVGISLASKSLPTDPYVSALHQALSRQLATSGWAATLLEQGQFEEQLSGIGGAILVGLIHDDPRIAACRSMDVAIIAIGYCNDPTVSSVVPDDAAGGELAVGHLVAAGCRSIGMMSSHAISRNIAMELRRDGALEAARRAGIACRTIDALASETNALSGYRTVWHHAADFGDLDGLFCDTDEHALGARAAFRDLAQHSTRPQRDIRIIGFDDLPQLSWDLTTIRQDFDKIAETAIALWRAAHDGAPTERVTLPVQLVERTSAPL